MQKYVIALYIRLSIEDYKYDSRALKIRALSSTSTRLPCRKL